MQETKAEKAKPAVNPLLAQVAKKARVSVGTVSRVFNNSSLVPSHTRCRVLSSARELGFRPRLGLRTKQVALVAEWPRDTIIGCYTHTMTQYITFALSRERAGITLITEDRINELKDCWFDGVIGIAWNDEIIKMLKGMKNIPIAWLNDQYADSFHSVYINPEQTGRIAGEYLWRKGHRKIAVIHEDSRTGFRRMDGVRALLSGCGADPRDHLLGYPNNKPLHIAVKQMLDAGCTAVWVTGEDMRSVEVYWLIREIFGKRIPEDVSVLGFEHPMVTEFLCPSQTSLVSPLRDLAEKAVEIVLRDDLDGLENIEYEVQLIERSSVCERSQ